MICLYLTAELLHQQSVLPSNQYLPYHRIQFPYCSTLSLLGPHHLHVAYELLHKMKVILVTFTPRCKDLARKRNIACSWMWLEAQPRFSAQWRCWGRPLDLHSSLFRRYSAADFLSSNPSMQTPNYQLCVIYWKCWASHPYIGHRTLWNLSSTACLTFGFLPRRLLCQLRNLLQQRAGRARTIRLLDDFVFHQWE